MPSSRIGMKARSLQAIVLLGLISVVLSTAPPSVEAVGGSTLDVFVMARGGVPIAGAEVSLGASTEVTRSEGRVRFTGASAGPITIRHSVYPDRTVEWTGTGDRMIVMLVKPVHRAVHVAGSIPGTPRWQELLDLADRTALNAVMLDMKDESGRVFPESDSAWAEQAGAVAGKWSLPAVVDEVHSRGLYLITRIVAFQDPKAGRAIPSMSAWNVATGGPFARRGQVFLDPTDPDARAYALELAIEACAAGVDEVQFDYVRFPDGFGSSVRFDGGSDLEVRVATITGFLAEARSALPPSCLVGADIFGFVVSIEGDGGIGQDLSALVGVVDVVSPMAYPNHWGRGWFGFSVPAHHPGPVIDRSSRDALERVDGTPTVLRPWLQDFGGYGPRQVRAQIDAADALGLGWMIWNAGSRFQEDGIPTDAEVSSSNTAPPPFVQALPPSGFWDVPATSGFSGDVRWLGEVGITRGCNQPWGDAFCPRRMISRGEAASMLVRGLDLPPSAVDQFDDDTGSVHEAAINSLAEAGITSGCSPRRFCPQEPLTRAQMAALVARALNLPPVEADTFDDDDGDFLEADIERIAAVGITRGCGVRKFCPGEAVLRDQVAAFLHRALAS